MALDDPNTPPEAGGFKSTLKIAVPLVALVGVIFGITLLSLYTPSDAPGTKKEGDGDDSGTGPSGLPPLVFFNTSREWDPPSVAAEFRNFPHLAPSRNPAKEKPDEFSLQDRIFPGFFEPDKQTPRRAAFWFENPHGSGVAFQLKGVSCGACSGGRVASIPLAVTRDYLERSALACLPIGLLNLGGVGLVEPAADFTKLEWDNRKYSDEPNATYRVPAAPSVADKWAPQWGILELTFTVSDNPKVPLTAAFASQIDGTPQAAGHQFAIHFAAVPPLAVSKPTIEVGEIGQLTPEREYNLTLFSATRGPKSEFGDLSPPTPSVQAPTGIAPGEFVKVTKIERVPEAQLLEVAQETAKSGVITKVLSAYRVTVTVRPQVGDARLELGALERTLSFGSDGATAAVKVTGQVRGAVWLASEKNDVDVGTFKGRLGGQFVNELVSESDAIDLAVVDDECKPRGVKYEIKKKPARGGRGYFDLVVTVPRGSQYGAFRDAIAVLEIRPPAPAPPQRIRIPVKGVGEQG